MNQSSLLFKAATVAVYRPAEQGGDTDQVEATVLQSGQQKLFIDTQATDLLVAYLRVMRAYFTGLPNSKRLIARLSGQLIAYLSDCLQQSGQAVITNGDVSNLISYLGCIDDWQHQYPRP